jgi:hypothetical protein
VTSDQLRQCFAMIVAAWPHYKPLPETFTLGKRLLEPMDARAVAAAIEQFSLEGREFAPPLGLVAKRAHEILARLEHSHVPDAQEAITEVYDRIARVGSYQTPTWSHPAIGATIAALGGWEATCLDDNPEAFRAHFMRLYELMRARTERESLVSPSMRELMDTAVERTALAPSREVDVPAVYERPVDRQAVLAELRQREKAGEPITFSEAMRRVPTNAHAFGDHSFCGQTCEESR